MKPSKSVFYLEPVDQQLQNAKQELDSCSSSQQYIVNSPSNAIACSGDEIMDEMNYFEERKNEYLEANLEKRKLVISELLTTEYSYIHDLKACHEAFMTNPNEGQLKGIDMDTLFGNLHQIILVSDKLYRSLEDATTDKEPEEVLIGPCFNAVSENMKSVYGNYCASHEAVINLMEKYQDDPDIQNFFSEKLEIIRRQTSCFNLSSLLIKPVQRILKYPLLLKELVKYTEDDHPDKGKVESAIQMMMDLATSVNEFKRRKDLVEKYRKDADTSIASLLSKLTLHSVVKKSTRIGMRLSSSIGLTSVTKDEVFDEEEQKIRSLDKTLRTFLKDLTTFCMQLEDWVKIQFQTAEDIAKFYMDQCNCPEVDKYRTAHRELYSIILHDFKNFVTNRVVIPLTSVLQTFQGPLKLIDKRYDKLLDYDSSSLRLQKNKDISKASQLNEEYQLTKNTYEALNSQLIEELPKLFNLALSVFQECVEDFAVARKRFIGRVVKQMLPLMELPSLHKINEDILESFQKAYVEACAELSLLSFVPKSLFPSKPDSLVKQSTEKKPAMINKDPESSQTEVHRKQLQTNYPDNKLYVVIYQHKAQDDYELTAVVGDVLGVIKEQDPMGKTNRWFVDNGIVKGFIPSSCLRKHQFSSISPLPCTVTSAGIPRTTASSKWYTQNTEENCSQEDFVNLNEPKSCISDLVISATSSENKSDSYDIPCDSSSHLYELPCDDDVPDNRYDFPAEEIGQQVDINEAKSPITSLVTLDKQEPFSVTCSGFEYFHAAYEFSANSSSELSLRMGQVVRVVHKQDMQGNTEWWFVEDRYGNKGFVPATYLSKC